MAHIDVHSFTAFGLDFEKHTATSYQIAKDENFEKIIDQSIYDTQNKLLWYSQLPKLPEDGGEGFYSDLNKLYSRVKIHFGTNIASPWITLKLENQNVQNFVITEDLKADRFSTSKELGQEDWEANFDDPDWTPPPEYIPPAIRDGYPEIIEIYPEGWDGVGPLDLYEGVTL